MKCSGCGAETSDALCPVCGVKPRPELIAGYSLLPQIFPGVSVVRSAKAFASRTWGEHHRFVQGQVLHAGEQELYRVRLSSVTEYSVDGQVTVARDAICLVTTERILARDVRGGFINLSLRDIQATSMRRKDDPVSGPLYTLTIERVGTTVHDPGGDIGLHCRNRRDAHELAEIIGRHQGAALPKS